MIRALLIILTLTWVPVASGFVLDFNDFEHFEGIGDYYAGGTNSAGMQGPDYSTRVFNAYVLNLFDESVMTFETAFFGDPFFYVDDLFSGGLAFRYASGWGEDQTLRVRVLDEHFTELANVTLLVPAWDGEQEFDWLVASIPFEGDAHQVIFSDTYFIGPAVVIDDMTFGRTTLVPVPAAFWLFGGAIAAGAGLFRQRGQR